MNTLEMMVEAKADGKTYKAGDIYYNVKNGFFDYRNKPWPGNAFSSLNNLFKVDDWEDAELKPLKITMADIEAKFGFPVEIVGRE